MRILSAGLPAFLLVVMGIISFAVTGCGNGSQSPQAMIDGMAAEMKTQLPKNLDEGTRLVNVYTEKLQLVTEYELLHFEANEDNIAVTAEKVEKYLKSQVCPGIKKDLLGNGVSSKYVYKAKGGQLLFEKTLKPGDC